MTDERPLIAVDIGNSRMKWGLCAKAGISHRAVLPADDPTAWETQLGEWPLSDPPCWAIASVHPHRLARFLDWATMRGEVFSLFRDGQHLPVRVVVQAPEKVGVDRLLNAVAAQSRLAKGQAGIIIDAGTAVTVDYLDAEGTFLGGAIVPGFQLMAEALHQHTAQLPRVSVSDRQPVEPAGDTESAIRTGIYWSVAGAVGGLTLGYLQRHPHVEVFLTGGDAHLLHDIDGGVILWPEMTLDGIRLASQLNQANSS